MSAPPMASTRPDSPAGGLALAKDRAKEFAHTALAPLVRGLVATGVRPDHLTVAGLLLSVGAGFAFFDGHSRLGALLLALAGVCDILDGEVARASRITSKFGAFLDSTLDRLAEAAALVGIAGFYVRNLFALVLDPELALRQIQEQQLDPVTWGVLALTAMLALTGSFMVSYTRARAEGLGLECRVGWFERPERLMLLVLAGVLKVFWAMSIALILLTALSFATAAQRVVHVWRNTRGAGLDA